MSAFLPNTEIKQELLFTLDKLIKHSQNEAQLLKYALDSLKHNPTKPEPDQTTVVKEELVDVTTEDFRTSAIISSQQIPVSCPPTIASPSTAEAAQTLLRIKEELSRELQRLSPRYEDDEETQPQAKRPRIELRPEFTVQAPAATPMVLVPIPADKVKELLMNGGTIPPMSLLSALPYSQVSEFSNIPPCSSSQHPSTVHHHPEQSPQPPSPTSSLHKFTTSPPSTSPTTSPTTSPLLSPTMSSSILRFCERRSYREDVDVFHYLPADARASPFPTNKPTNYRQYLDDITKTKVKIPKLPKSYEALPKLSPGMNERTVYTPFQTERLEESFRTNPFLTKEQRERLSKELSIHAGRIKVWYQNRRARKRREEVLKEKIETAARTGSTTASND